MQSNEESARVRAAVRFQGLDWVIEEEKSQQGSKNRKDASIRRRQQKQQRKKEEQQRKLEEQKRKMEAQKQQKLLQDFLQFAAKHDNETSAHTRDMINCDRFLEHCKEKDVVKSDCDESKLEKLQWLIDNLESWTEENPSCFHTALSWLYEAVDCHFYSIPDSNQDENPLVNKVVELSDSPNRQSSITSSVSGGSQVNETTHDESDIIKFRRVVDLLDESLIQEFLGELSKCQQGMEGDLIAKIIAEIRGLTHIHESHGKDAALELFEEKYGNDNQKGIAFLHLVFERSSVFAVTTDSIASRGASDTTSRVSSTT